MPVLIFNIRLLLLILSALIVDLSWAESFRIENIRVEGLQRIAIGTVFNYLPIKVGDTLNTDETANLIHSLYATGFFKEVVIARDGDILVVKVRERPAIGVVTIEGNHDISTDKLKTALKDIGLTEGRVFNRSILDKIKQELQRQYFSRGKYAMTLDTKITPLERNRIAIKLVISEGITARIKGINIIGNEVFSDSKLLGLLDLGTPTWISGITHSDRYSKPKFAGDLETLRSFYMDRGYINFKIESTQVSITSDKKDVYLTIAIHEGEVHTISDIKLAGNLVVPKEDLFPLIQMQRGEVFSRKEVTASSERIGEMLGNYGYAFANVNNIPEIDSANKQVSLTFFIDPGKRVYVRRINITGNTKTRDEVLRRELRQMEAAWYSGDLIKRSKEKLQRLGFFEDVTIKTSPVSGSADEVDIDIAVTEKGSGVLAASIGYSQTDGIVFSTSITQNNFLGSGKQLSLGFNNSSSNTRYSLSYNNPYYTIDGISRGFDFSYSKTDFAELNVLNYATDVGSAGINFGLPISDTGRVGFGIAYVSTNLRVGTSTLAQKFETEHGATFDDYRIQLNWRNDARDSALLPTTGSLQKIFITLSPPPSDLEFYRVTYSHDRYIPLWGDLILNLNGEVGYGGGLNKEGSLPFFENFFAGGYRSVRGFRQNTLGPRETNDLGSDPIGGNLKLIGGVEIIWPSLFGEKTSKALRITTFFDIGNVWLTSSNDLYTTNKKFNLEDLRYSVGIGASWLSPIGAISLSLGFPLNAKDGDSTENFQFNLGQTF
ncbi:membrane protein [Achromatium sp. WMS2]|nr:membrane protein [Achromatium sp. WMS2]